MKHLTLRAIGLTILITCSFLCVLAQTQTKPIKKPSTGQVNGRVTISGKGAAGVVVELRTHNSGSWTDAQSKAITNDEGKYQIGGLAPGSYLIAPIAWAFVSVERNPDGGGGGRPVVIADDESVENLDFALVRGAVITGKVTDANGRPVIEETVSLTSTDPGRPFYPVNQNFQTDDRGVYRMFGIPAGRFKVSVGQGDDDLSGGGRGRPVYRKTFFPQATDPAKANVVEVAEGAEMSNIDITVGKTIPGFSASGRVVDGESGRPLPNTTIHLTRTVIIDASSSSSVGEGAGQSDNQGEFQIKNLVPGHYSLSIYPNPPSDIRADPVVFDVIDQDVSGLRITTSAGASVEGTVVLEGSQESSVAAKLTKLYLSASVEDESNHTSSGESAQILGNRSFRIGGLQAGLANFSLRGSSELKGFTIVRIERDGVAQASGIQIRNGEHLTGVKVTVAYGTATIRGVVKLENGTLPADARLSVHLSSLAYPLFDEGTGVDSRGNFVIERLVAGSYELTLYVFGHPGPAPQRPRSFTQFVNVSEGGVTEVTVPVNLKQNTAPAGRP
jgi:hypothetical protein